jgi:hypothetical protein
VLRVICGWWESVELIAVFKILLTVYEAMADAKK